MINFESDNAIKQQLIIFQQYVKKDKQIEELEKQVSELKIYKQKYDSEMKPKTSILDQLWDKHVLSSDDKQNIFIEAQRPVEALRQKIDELKLEREYSNDKEKKELTKKINNLYEKLDRAKEDAAKNIYNRLNSSDFSVRHSEEFCYDLHGFVCERCREYYSRDYCPCIASD